MKSSILGLEDSRVLEFVFGRKGRGLINHKVSSWRKITFGKLIMGSLDALVFVSVLDSYSTHL